MAEKNRTGITIAESLKVINGPIYVNGVPVIAAAKGAAITPPSGGTTIDTQGRAAIASIISQLQASGITN